MTGISSLLLVLLGLFAVFTNSQFLSAKSSQFQIQVYNSLPMFYFSTLDGSKTVQNISINFLHLSELVLPTNTSAPISQSTMVVGSSINFASLLWSVTNTTMDGNYIFDISTTSSEKQAPGWTGFTIQLTWDGKSTQFTTNIGVTDFTWLTDSDTTCIGIFIGVEDITNAQNITGSPSNNKVTIAKSTISISATASITGDVTATAPAWLWENTGDVMVLQVGNFNGTLSTMNELVTLDTTKPSSGMGFWSWFFIVVAILAFIGVIGVLIAAAVGFVLHRRNQKANMYDNI